MFRRRWHHRSAVTSLVSAGDPVWCIRGCPLAVSGYGGPPEASGRPPSDTGSVHCEALTAAPKSCLSLGTPRKKPRPRSSAPTGCRAHPPYHRRIGVVGMVCQLQLGVKDEIARYSGTRSPLTNRCTAAACDDQRSAAAECYGSLAILPGITIWRFWRPACCWPRLRTARVGQAQHAAFRLLVPTAGARIACGRKSSRPQVSPPCFAARRLMPPPIQAGVNVSCAQSCRLVALPLLLRRLDVAKAPAGDPPATAL